MIVAPAANRGTETSAKESAANNMGIDPIVQRSDRPVTRCWHPDHYRLIRRAKAEATSSAGRRILQSSSGLPRETRHVVRSRYNRHCSSP
jgi:hypothetical protein